MDPFIEMSEWSNFHSDIIAQIKDQLQPLILPRYLVLTETRVYLERADQDSVHFIPDAAISPTLGRPVAPAGSGETAIAEIEPEVYIVPMSEEHREPYLVLRDREENEVVTVIEVLSPTNKLPGSVGKQVYSDKRAELLRSHVNLLEIDLLRDGQRARLNRPLKPTTDYCVLLHRISQRPKVHVWEFGIRNRLTAIPIPLAAGDPDVRLDLQAAVNSIYDRLGYSLRVPYHKPLQPPPRPQDKAWLQQTLSQSRPAK
jgi:hypothetical protein